MSLFELENFEGSAAPLCRDDDSGWISYGDAYKKIVQIIDEQNLGCDAAKRLILFSGENSTQSLLYYIACLSMGHTLVLLSKDTPASTLSTYTAAFNPDMLISFDQGKPIVQITRDIPLSEIADEICLLLSTSGSTGDPRFAKFTADAMRSNAQSIIEYLGITSSDTALAHLPMNYSFGVSILNSHILARASLVFTNKSMMELSYWDSFSEVTSFSGVPFHYEMLDKLRFHRKTFPKLKTLTQAGGALSPTLIKKFAENAEENGQNFFVMYGQTEASPRLAYLPPEACHDHAGKIGCAIPGVTLSVQNPMTGEALPPGQEGELIAYSPSITLGYVTGREDLNDPDSFGGRLATGDLAIQTESGFFQITGRMSRFIKLQGNRVNLSAIEQRLGEIGFEVICVGEDEALFVVLLRQDEVDTVKALITEHFEFSPRAFKVVPMDNIPRSDSGKPAYAKILDNAKRFSKGA